MPPKLNDEAISVHFDDLMRLLRAHLLASADGWMSVTEAAHELDLTPAYVSRMALSHRLAAWRNGRELLICAHHVAEERARRAARRERRRR